MKELTETQELVRNTYQSQECKERVMRALHGKIRENEVELVNNGDKIYYKKLGEEK